MATSKVGSFFNRKKDEEDEEQLQGSTNKHAFLTLGAFINYGIVVDFAAIFVACLIVVGSLGTLQKDISDTQGGNKGCYMYATSSNGNGTIGTCNFQLEAAHPCDGAMVGFSLIAAMCIGFMVSLVIKGLLHHDLNWTLYLEVPSLIVGILFVFALCVTISIGNVTTCNSIKSYHKCRGEYDKACNGSFPTSTFTHGTRAVIAQNTSWFVLFFLFIAIVLFVIRLAVFLKRKRKSMIQNTLANESFGDQDDSETKPI